MPIPLRVLIVEDSPDDAELMVLHLTDDGFQPEWQRVQSEADYLEALATVPDLILADWSLPQFSGSRALQLMKERRLDTPFVIVSGSIGEEAAVEAMRQGAADYLLKDRQARLGQTVRHALEDKQLREKRKRAEEALAESEKKFRWLYEYAPTAYHILTPDGLITDVNHKWCELLGYSKDEAIGKSIFDFMMVEEEREAAKASFEKKKRSKQSFVEGSERRFLTRDGAVKTFKIYDALSLDESGAVSSVQTAIEDITERKRAEEALRESEKKYRELIDGMNETVWVIDFNANLVDVNNTAVEVLGYSKEELLTMGLYGVDSSLKREDIKALAKAMPSDKLQIFETSHTTKEGRTFPVEVYSSLVTYKGEKAILSIARNITERKQAEDALRKRASELAAVHQTGQRLRTLRTPEQLAQEIIQVLEEVVGYDYGAVLLIEEGTDRLVPFALSAQGRGPEFVQADKEYVTSHAPRLGEGITGWVAQTGQSICLDDVAQDARYYPMRAGICSELCIPLIVEDTVIGVVNVESTRPNAYGESDQRVLETVAAQIGIAIQNARLYENIQQELAERKRLEAARDQERILLRTIIDNFPNSIFVKDKKYRKIVVNPEHAHRVTAHLGPASPFSEEDLLGKTDLEVYPRGLAEGFLVEDQRVIEGDQSVLNQELLSIDANGRTHWELMSKIPLRDRNGEIIGLVGISNDITERKRAEQALQQSELLFRALFELSPDAVVLIDPHDPNVSWPIIDCNAAACLMNGYRRDELIGQSVDIVNAAPYTPAGQSAYLKKLREVGNLKFEVLHRHKSGAVFPIEISTTIIKVGERELVIGIDRDITERKQAEEALRQSEERYRGLVELSPDAVFIERNDGTIAFINQAGLKLFGATSPKQILGRNVKDFIHPDYRGAVSERFQAVRSKKKDVPVLEEKYLRLDGSSVDVEVAAISFAYEGKPGAQVIVRDITERKQAEQELLISEERFAKAFRASPVAISISTFSEGRMIDANEAFLHLLEYDRQEVIGHTALELNMWAKPDERLQIELRLMTNEFPYNKESLLWTKSGILRHVLVSAEIITLGGKPCVLMMLNDITERKRAEEAIHRQLAELEVLYESGLAISRLLTPKEIARRVLEILLQRLAWHHAAIRLYHPETRRIELLALSQPGQSAEEIQKQIKRINRTMGPLGQGLSGWVIQHGRPVRSGDVRADKRYVATYSDIRSGLYIPIRVGRQTIGSIAVESEQENAFTEADERLLATLAAQAAISFENARLYQEAKLEIAERKRVELELAEERAMLAQRVEERTADLSRANAELARAMRARDEFLSTMSHELRTPLNAVLSLSESLEEGVYGEMTSEQVSTLQMIAESGRHLLGLINDILDVSKIESGKLTLEIANLDVTEICASAMRLVKQPAAQKKIQMTFSQDSSIISIKADGRRLKQMLVNLLSNAVKFTPEQGKVGLEVASEAKGEAIRFTVWDTGIGIEPDKLPLLFQPFVQLDSALTRSHTGTGLGLSLVKKLAELHGGSVGVESRPGKGSRFYFILPANPPDVSNEAQEETGRGSDSAAEEKRASASPRRPGAGRAGLRREKDAPCILIAEDNPVSLKNMSDYLRSKGYRVIHASNGFEALERALEFKPDLILMDIQMPELDGLEATSRLRAKPEFASTPIIAVTALAMPGDRQRCLQAGANEYMTKPVSLRALEAQIETLLKSSR